MRSWNLPLLLGGVLSLLIVGIAVVGPFLAPHDPMESYDNITRNGVMYGLPPDGRNLPPFSDAAYPLGWDFGRRDLLSRILYAVRPTLVLCLVIALLRIVAGTLFGLVAGWWGGWAARTIDALAGAALALPALVVSVGVLLLVAGAGPIVSYLLALSVAGWVDVAALVRARTAVVLRAPFIESARAIGVGPVGILARHVAPQLVPLLPLTLAYEMSAVLLLMAELGYLGFFIGGGAILRSGAGNTIVTYFLDGQPELAQMLSGFFQQLYDTPWQSPLVGLLIAVMLTAFALLSEGLRRKLDITRR